MVGRAEVTDREIANLASVVAEILERGVSPFSVFTTSFLLDSFSLIKGLGRGTGWQIIPYKIDLTYWQCYHKSRS